MEGGEEQEEKKSGEYLEVHQRGGRLSRACFPLSCWKAPLAGVHSCTLHPSCALFLPDNLQCLEVSFWYLPRDAKERTT